MKKALSLILILIMSVTLSVSCTQVAENSTDTSQYESSGYVSESTSESSLPEPETTVHSAYYADYIEAANDILLVKFYDKNTLIVVKDGVADIYDINERKLLNSQNLDIDYCRDVVVCDDGSIIYYSSMGFADVYDGIYGADPVFKKEQPERDEDEDDDNSGADIEYIYAPDKTYVYLHDNVLYKCDGFSSLPKTVCEISGNYFFTYLIYYDGEYAFLRSNCDNIIVNVNTGDISRFYCDGNNAAEISGSRVFEYTSYYEYCESGEIYRSIITYKPGDYSRDKILLENEQENYLFSEDDIVYTVDQPEAGYNLILRAYDLEGNVFFREEAGIDGEHYAFATGGDKFGDMFAAVVHIEEDPEEPSETKVFIVTDRYDANVVRTFARTLQDYARDFKEETGLNAFVGANSERWFPDYNCEPMNDKELVRNNLEVIAQVINEFPTGFFDELLDPDKDYTCKSIDFYIVGAITGREDGTISSASAFTTEEDGKRIIVIDANTYYSDELRNTVAHELMHIIDNYMVMSNAEQPYFDEWYDYAPFEYYEYSYVDRYGNDYYDDEYTIASGKKVYFIDYYSKTYPWEDRARLFEYMFCKEKAEFNDCFSYEKIRNRALYLADEIRRCFKSVSESDELIWEKTIHSYAG